MSLFWVMTILVAITALAFVVQAGIMFSMYRAIMGFRREFDSLRADIKPRLDLLAESVTEIVVNSREPIKSITANVADVSRIVRERTEYVDAVVAEISSRTRDKVIRIDNMLENLVEKAHSTADKVERGVAAPVHEASAVIKGVRAGIEFLLAGRSPKTGEVTQDEQMFI
jgi:hypothetical protein